MPRPTTATVKRLFAVSGNRCAFPGCANPLVTDGTVTAEICHIKAQSAGGPRYDPAQTDKERHGFDNLVLMCGDHHKVIDADPTTYTVEELHRIKTEHEAKYAGGTEPSDDVARQFVSQVHIGDVVHGDKFVGDKVLGDKITYVQPPQPPLPPYDPPPPPDPDELPDPGTLPPGSRLPFARNALFTGREEPLKALARALLHAEGPATLVTQAVQGMGGMGKTQLAVEFAYRYGRFFHGVHWVNATQPEGIEAEIAACGQVMHPPYWPAEQPEQVELTLREWQRGGPRLVVLDNLEDVGAAREWLVRLSGGPTRVLVTARRCDWPADLGLDPLRLEVFAPDEGRAFLRRYLPEGRAGDADVDALAERLGHLPLALDLAGRYLAGHPRLSIAAYLEKLDDVWSHPSMARWREDLGSPTDHDLGLAATFAVSWEQVTDEAARRVFLAAGFCAPNEPIPCELLERAAGLEEEASDEAVGALAGLGLLEMADIKVGPTTHPLLAEYARRQKGASVVLPPLVDALAQMAEAFIEQLSKTGNPAHFAPLVPHVQALAPAAEEEGAESAHSLWHDLGLHLNRVADYPGARAAYERALMIQEAASGSDHPRIAASLDDLGGVLHHLGDYPEARTAHERALAIREAAFGPNHPDVATSLSNLGNELHAQGDYARAQTVYERALAIREAAFGLDHPDVAESLHNVGIELGFLGNYAGMQAALRQALGIWEAASGSNHPDAAESLHSMGAVLYFLRDHAGALAAYERALAIDEAVYGLVHPQVATSLGNLGNVLYDVGDHAGALAAYERALTIREATFGPDHPDVAESLHNVGRVLHSLGNLAGARAAYERALAIDEAAHGPDHLAVAVTLHNIGKVLSLEGLAEAQEYFKRALVTAGKSLPQNHPRIKRFQSALWSTRFVQWFCTALFIGIPVILGLVTVWMVINSGDLTLALLLATAAVSIASFGAIRWIWISMLTQAIVKLRQTQEKLRYLLFRWRTRREKQRHTHESKEE